MAFNGRSIGRRLDEQMGYEQAQATKRFELIWLVAKDIGGLFLKAV